MRREEALDSKRSRYLNQLQGVDVQKETDFFFESERFVVGRIKPGIGTIVIPEVDSPVIQSVFLLTPECEIRLKCGNDRLIIGGGKHNLVSLNDLGVVKINSTDCIVESFYIIFFKDAVPQLLGEDSACFFRFMKGRHSLEVLSGKSMCITAEMRSIIQEIVTCKKVGLLKKMFIEAKVLKLLMLQLEQSEISEGRGTLKFIKEYDVEKIHQAKMIVDEDLSNSISLIELAHMVGLNDFKLKRGFKEIYNTTVYNYLYELRMQEAKKRLLGTDQSVNEIASYCGYEFVQSFIKAFKRKFGISPDKFRNNHFG